MWHASCSQICRITSHIRACGPSSGDAFESVARRQPFWPSRITTQIQPASLTAKITVNLLLATSIWPPPLSETINTQLLPATVLVSRLEYCLSILPHAIRVSTCPLSHLTSSRISTLLRAPTRHPAAALAGPKLAPGKEHLALQEALTASSIYCQKRHLAVVASSATRSAYLVLHLHRHTHIPTTAYDRALVAAASPCFGRA